MSIYAYVFNNFRVTEELKLFLDNMGIMLIKNSPDISSQNIKIMGEYDSLKRIRSELDNYFQANGFKKIFDVDDYFEKEIKIEIQDKDENGTLIFTSKGNPKMIIETIKRKSYPKNRIIYEK